MRYIKIFAAMFILCLALPERALAHYDSPYEVGGALLLLFPLIIFCTSLGGGYLYMKITRDIIGFIIIGAVLMIFYVPYGILPHDILLFLCCAAYAIARGARMIRWGFIEGGKSGVAGHIEKAKPWRLKLGGWLLVVSTLLFIIAPLTYSPSYGFNDRDTKSNLHNLYLGCKAYWADNDSSANCTVDIVAGTTYGYVQSPMVTITGSGDEAHFSATAGHAVNRKIFAMDHNGIINKTSATLPKEPERSWLDETIDNIKINLRLLEIL